MALLLGAALAADGWTMWSAGPFEADFPPDASREEDEGTVRGRDQGVFFELAWGDLGPVGSAFTVVTTGRGRLCGKLARRSELRGPPPPAREVMTAAGPVGLPTEREWRLVIERRCRREPIRVTVGGPDTPATRALAERFVAGVVCTG